METFPFSKYFDADRGRGLPTTADCVANSCHSLFKFFLVRENFAETDLGFDVVVRRMICFNRGRDSDSWIKRLSIGYEARKCKRRN